MFAVIIMPLLRTFAAGVVCGKPTFLGLVPWYQYLDVTKDAAGKCSVVNFNPAGDGSQAHAFGAHSPFLLIALAIIDDLIRVAALVAVAYVIVGGIQYVTSQGAPDATKKAQQTIINALIGLAIALVAASVVAFIGNKLGK